MAALAWLVATLATLPTWFAIGIAIVVWHACHVTRVIEPSKADKKSHKDAPSIPVTIAEQGPQGDPEYRDTIDGLRALGWNADQARQVASQRWRAGMKAGEAIKLCLQKRKT